MGRTVQYARRKRDRECWNGVEREMSNYKKICACKEEDYECDLGY